MNSKSAVAIHQSTTSGTPSARLMLQRKCACGGAFGPTGECVACRRGRLLHPPPHRQRRSSLTHTTDESGRRDIEPDGSMIEPDLAQCGDQAHYSLDESGSAQATQLPRRVLPLAMPTAIADGQQHADLDQIETHLGPGRSLHSMERAPLEAASPVTLSHVRLHDSRQSHLTADLLNSQAFTYGNHIVLGNAGNGTPTHRMWLLAHETAHVIQQQPQIRAIQPHQTHERSQSESEADQFADAIVSNEGNQDVVLPPPLGASVGLARKVIWKHIQDLPNDLLLIIDVDDGDFVGGCVRAIVPHAGVKLIKKHPHTQLFNLHVGFMTNAAGQYCMFFYESVTGICELKCFPSRQELEDAWDEVAEWLQEMLEKVLKALGILALIIIAALLAYLIAQAIIAALLAAGLVFA